MPQQPCTSSSSQTSVPGPSSLKVFFSSDRPHEASAKLGSANTPAQDANLYDQVLLFPRSVEFRKKVGPAVRVVRVGFSGTESKITFYLEEVHYANLITTPLSLSLEEIIAFFQKAESLRAG